MGLKGRSLKGCFSVPFKVYGWGVVVVVVNLMIALRNYRGPDRTNIETGLAWR